MNCQVKKALFPWDDTSFWNDLCQFCKEYGEWIYTHETKMIALSDQVGDMNLELVEQPTIEATYGAKLGEYTLVQKGNAWAVLKGEKEVAVLNSWENLAEDEDLDHELASLIREVKAKKEEQRKAFIDKVLSRQTKVDAVKRPDIRPSITEEIQDEDDGDFSDIW